VSCNRAAADVERDSVGECGRVDGGEIAVARLLLRESTWMSRPARSRARDEILAVRGLADRDVATRRTRDAGGAAEVRETARSSPARAPSARAAAAAGLLTLADPHRLVDLVRALPPVVVYVNTTSRKEFDPRSMTATRCSTC
jgi:hypothetical protein